VKPDTYTYNTLINALAKSGDGNSAARAEEILNVMEQRFQAGDKSFKPNTRSHTSVIDAWAKSGEAGAARRAEQILENLKALYESTGDTDIKPNVYTANAVMNVSCSLIFLCYGHPLSVLISFPNFFLGMRVFQTRRGSRRGIGLGLSYLCLA
jgi:pentatricopeptide repeat protein